jgi:23S rRNA pseudouridine2605 synthase
MAEKTTPARTATKTAPKTAAPEGDRIAKVLSRAGVASRREAERMIELGEVSVNGKVITSPALNVTAKDKITVRGELVREPEQARLWLYYKPDGLVTSESDEKGRETVFDNLPEDLPRVMSVGRLDLNSEGLLLLTNDGTLKRRLELPSTGWLRKYRVRVNGNPTDPDLEPLRKGIEVEGERFQPMIVILDRIQGANAWLTVGLREGKNREIRRAMSAINLTVNRLIRVSYGPFRLGDLQPGQVEEVKGKVLRDQLGEGRTPEDEAPRKVVRAPRGAAASRTATGSKAETARPKAEREAPRARPDSTKPTRPAKPGSALTELSKAWTVATTAKPRGIAPKKAGVDKPSAPTKPRNTPAAPRSATPGRGKPGPRPKRGE